MFTPRTEPVKQGEKPFNWDVPSVWQCTWFGFYEAIRCFGSAPTFWDRATHTGSYPNANLWLENYRDPWQVKGVDYVPVAGDIAVFDGEYGHIQFLETDTMYAEYKNGDPNSFAIGKFEKKPNLLGFLHYPYEPVVPVERNAFVDQIETTDEDLRIRTAPSLNAEIVGYVQLGYYNVIQSKEADGHTWYEIGKDRWCADVTTIFLPAEDDVIKEIERVFNQLKSEINDLNEDNKMLKGKLKEINRISNVDDKV